jgi:hypothetical protein
VSGIREVTDGKECKRRKGNGGNGGNYGIRMKRELHSRPGFAKYFFCRFQVPTSTGVNKLTPIAEVTNPAQCQIFTSGRAMTNYKRKGGCYNLRKKFMTFLFSYATRCHRPLLATPLHCSEKGQANLYFWGPQDIDV